MADSGDSMPGGAGAEDPVGAAERAGERPANFIAEFVDAARSAAESVLHQQQHQVAGSVSGIAEALRAAAASLERSDNAVIARYLAQTANQVDDLSQTVRRRYWSEFVADTEDLARRRPALFIAGAVAAGFTLGRLLSAATSGPRPMTAPGTSLSASAAAAPEVGAAVSGTSGMTAEDAREAGAGDPRVMRAE